AVEEPETPGEELNVGGDIAARGVDVISAFENRAIQALEEDADLMARVRDSGIAWGSLKAFFLEALPTTLDDRDTLAYNLVPKALNRILGQQGESWHTFRNPGTRATWVRAGRDPSR